ncbi:PREDICTED: melanocortin-2 receptor accessory protein [Miniopterus natalensis]|uniref:melanocortin-2 receptor accessory protein n=1 Tax=Miniopterus natalensis TaxID=291302 RepID=UPI0007A708B4|nr:PREDICTED: melanocortin-2 receptor accessory protein [Miniopterus natalensis]
MANGTNASTPHYSYEYYLDYLDLIPVDEKKLRAHKYSVVIAFWVSLAAFVVLLFLILLYMSWPSSPQARNAQHRSTCPWSLHLDLPLCVRRHLLLHRASQGTPQASLSSAGEGEPGSRASDASASTPTAPEAHPALLWDQALDGDPHSIS